MRNRIPLLRSQSIMARNCDNWGRFLTLLIIQSTQDSTRLWGSCVSGAAMAKERVLGIMISNPFNQSLRVALPGQLSYPGGRMRFSIYSSDRRLWARHSQSLQVLMRLATLLSSQRSFRLTWYSKRKRLSSRDLCRRTIQPEKMKEIRKTILSWSRHTWNMPNNTLDKALESPKTRHRYFQGAHLRKKSTIKSCSRVTRLIKGWKKVIIRLD